MPTVLVSAQNNTGDKTQGYELRGESSLFDELEAQGLTLPHGCLAGSCSACKVKIIEGAENLSNADPIEQNTLSSFCNEPNLRLSCRAKIIKGRVHLSPYKS